MYGSKLLCQRSHLSLLEGDLRGKVVWITGASTGIGAALAVEAAKYGAKVAISARTHGKLEETKKRCIGRGKLFQIFLFRGCHCSPRSWILPGYQGGGYPYHANGYGQIRCSSGVSGQSAELFREGRFSQEGPF